MIDFAEARRAMVDSQLRPNGIIRRSILDTMGQVPRELFVPRSRRSVAYADQEIEIGGGRFLMCPMTFGRMLQAAALDPGDSVLDIGCGTGYSTTVMASLAGAVVAVEQDPALAEAAQKTLSELGVDNAVVVQSALIDGYPAEAPYDAIIVEGATACDMAPLGRQLREGGRMVHIAMEGVVGRIVVAVRSGDRLSRRMAFDATAAVLPGFEAEETFVF